MFGQVYAFTIAIQEIIKSQLLFKVFIQNFYFKEWSIMIINWSDDIKFRYELLCYHIGLS